MPANLFTRVSIVAATMATAALAQDVPLASRHFTYPDTVPFRVDTDDGPRGRQQGYNQCNSTTEGASSMCQTFFTNDITDFCLMGPPVPDSLVADTEGEMVAWCTKAGRGTRLIPDGALQGVQFITTPGYIEIVGMIDQTKINMKGDDSGGELDPHGADGRGNPLGGIMFSQAFSSGAWTQVTQWHSFMGGNMFCLKACIPGGNAATDVLCNNIYDRIGCSYNVPANYAAVNGTFQSCKGDNQLPPGVYVENGATMTYQQPAESLGAISSIPYQPFVPASSACTPYTSAAIYTDAAKIASVSQASASSVASVSSASVARTASHTGPTPAPAGSRSGSSPAATGSSGSTSGATSPIMEGLRLVPAVAMVMALLGGAMMI